MGVSGKLNIISRSAAVIAEQSPSWKNGCTLMMMGMLIIRMAMLAMVGNYNDDDGDDDFPN